jgi:hypothetical protein
MIWIVLAIKAYYKYNRKPGRCCKIIDFIYLFKITQF